MDRYNVDFPDTVLPDPQSDEERLITQTGIKHEADVLSDFRKTCPQMIEIVDRGPAGCAMTRSAIQAKAPIIYQAALEFEQFGGLADFIELCPDGKYQVWDTKLARSPKPYYAIQLCCYSEMLAETLGESLPEKFGIILGTRDRVEFRVEDFIYYYRGIKSRFLGMQESFDGDISHRPEPLPGADHGRWTSLAEKYFADCDHLIKVAGISVGQIKKLKKAGIATLASLAEASRRTVPKLAPDSFEKLVAQARLQCATRILRQTDPLAPPQFEILPIYGKNGEAVGLAALPPAHPADVFFDMEGYPLVAGGLEYLFGVCTRETVEINGNPTFEFKDWWAHTREEEKLALEGFIDWVFLRWTTNPGMHIYHYASYEVSAVRRLSTRHDTRQEEVDELLRNKVFVDLYRIIERGLRVGEESYSIKSIEHLYRPRRTTEVSTAVDSVVHYAQWMESGQESNWMTSEILKDIRDYNKDDCVSTEELEGWLRPIAAQLGTSHGPQTSVSAQLVPEERRLEVIEREKIAARLRELGDPVSIVLADLIGYHRREEKPMWWRMFDRAVSAPEALCEDFDCIEGVTAVGDPVPVKQSLMQSYRFKEFQDCKLSGGETTVMFAHKLDAKFTLIALDTTLGTLQLKISKKALEEKLGGEFPRHGSLIPYELVAADAIQTALSEVASNQLAGNLSPVVDSLLNRRPPSAALKEVGETAADAAIRITRSMSGECLCIQGPPGTGKTYTASHVIKALLVAGKKVGVTSNSHKAIINLLVACGDAVRNSGGSLKGIKVGGDEDERLHVANPNLRYVKDSSKAKDEYHDGVIGGTAWLFVRPEWEGKLDFLFIDEAGQVSLANAVAMARCAKNLILLGDQMQLEQPIQGYHPGDAEMSVLQYVLKDTIESKPDAPILHAVIPPCFGLFLGESWRMHPDVCAFISQSIYEGRLKSNTECARQTILLDATLTRHVTKRSGIVFSPTEHDGNVQCSDEEVARVLEIYQELLGRPYIAKYGSTRNLALQDFLFISPYNAQVRALKAKLSPDARVGSVDKFQGQEAPVCILSLCSSYGEYGHRGLGFILDQNRINVAISRAQCLAVVVADPRIAGSPVNSIAGMKLVNLFCRLVDCNSPG